MGYPDDHPAAIFRHYVPTDELVSHPIEDGVTGRAWRYRPPKPKATDIEQPDTPGSGVGLVMITVSLAPSRRRARAPRA